MNGSRHEFVMIHQDAVTSESQYSHRDGLRKGVQDKINKLQVAVTSIPNPTGMYLRPNLEGVQDKTNKLQVAVRTEEGRPA